MMHAEMGSTALWLMLLLGAYHGINPGMGWLFAVALGMQEQKGSAVARSLVPMALGHALAIGSVVLAAAFLGMALPREAIRYPVAALLVGLGILSLVRHHHPRWVRMQVGFRDLTLWSFLMASAHGAGLMVLPVLLGSSTVEAADPMAGHHHTSAAASPLAALLATGGPYRSLPCGHRAHRVGWSIASSASRSSARRGSTSTWYGPLRSWSPAWSLWWRSPLESFFFSRARVVWRKKMALAGPALDDVDYAFVQARARSSNNSRSRALRVSAAARSNSARASSNRPSFLSRSPRTLGNR